MQIFIDGISQLPSKQYTVLATLPEGYRPKTALSWTCTHHDGRLYRINIDSAGNINGYNYSNNDNYINAVNAYTFIVD